MASTFPTEFRASAAIGDIPEVSRVQHANPAPA